MSYKPCSENGFCEALLKRSTNAMSTQAKGFIRHEFIDVQTGEDSGMVMAYSAGKGDKGLALNFCPFCGFSFHGLYTRKTRVGACQAGSAV